MHDQGAVVSVNVTPSLIAAWFHRLFTHPVVEIDGQEQAARWGTTEIAVSPGEHCISVFFRYRRQHHTRLAETTREFSTDTGVQRVDITARLGPRNGSRFRIETPSAHR
ncbi:hypothetical protein [Streptomyces sp. HUAS TT7]|uniref:hypothetical protein n=1 Tax=Streptomyces sp. HUAS TT7 TaxID=3447507 RepID=UPI003F6560EE